MPGTVSTSSQCPLEKETDFFLQIEQHSLFLLFIKLVASLALSMPESLTGQLREACLGQLAVCAPQLKAAFHAGVMKLKMPTHYADYADSVHNYMAQVLDISVPILGGSIPRPPAGEGVFPPYVPEGPRPVPPKTSTPSSSDDCRREASSLFRRSFVACIASNKHAV